MGLNSREVDVEAILTCT